jgi:hypothetical protein
VTDPDDIIFAKIHQPYSDDELREIAQVLGIDRLSNLVREKLEYAAKLYLIEWEAERRPKAGEGRFFPKREERSAAYKKVAKTARELKKALEVPGFSRAFERRFPEEKENWPEFDLEQLEALAKAAEKAAIKAGKRGADPQVARRDFIKRLVPVFEAATGKKKKAARSHDPYSGKNTGLFLKFVEKCLGPLTPTRAERGLDDDVRRALKEMSPTRRA